jgi:RimJ/RimL family protein N-acetyltransferase
MIETDRLILRSWRDEDGPGFVRVTNTPAVMAHLGGVQDPDLLMTSVERQQRMQRERGHCFWIVERRADGALLGFCGLKAPCVPETPVADDVEIGWRLREDAWGRGYAKEAALASLAWGWTHLDAARIVAITVPANTASWGLMERLAMRRRANLDFDHPAFAPDHPLRRHITYVAERPH